MSQGYEGELKVGVPTSGFTGGVPGETGIGWLMECTGESLEVREELRNKDNLITGKRIVDIDTQAIAQEFPGGDFTVRPYMNDVLPLLMGYFQCVDLEGSLSGGADGTFMGPSCSGGGTFTFTSIEDQPDFVGSSWGSYHNGSNFTGTIVSGDIYPLNVNVRYAFIGTGVYNVRRFYDGVVSSLAFSQPFNEDLALTVGCEFQGQTVAKLYGDMADDSDTMEASDSSKDIIVDWKGTVSIGDEGGASKSEVEAESLEVSLDNALEGVGVLGHHGYKRYTFGRGELGGSFEHEMDEDIRDFMAGTNASFLARWEISTSEWMQIEMPNIAYQPNTPALTGGDARTIRSIPFRAFSSDGTPAVIVKVATLLFEGTAGFDNSVNTDWPADA